LILIVIIIRQSLLSFFRFFDISLASIAESSSAIDVMLAFDLISKQSADEFRSQFRIAYAMIVNLKKSGF